MTTTSLDRKDPILNHIPVGRGTTDRYLEALSAFGIVGTPKELSLADYKFVYQGRKVGFTELMQTLPPDQVEAVRTKVGQLKASRQEPSVPIVPSSDGAIPREVAAVRAEINGAFFNDPLGR